MATRFRSPIALLIAVGLLSVSFLPALAQDPREMLVSLIQLIANPAEFDQRRVLVVGYVVLEFENKKMCLNESDAKHGITRNCMWLDVSDAVHANRAQFSRRYVLVEGTFNARSRGHLDLSGGQIENIKRFELVN